LLFAFFLFHLHSFFKYFLFLTLKSTFAKNFKGVQFTPLLNLAKAYFTEGTSVIKLCKKTTLPRETSIVSDQERCKEKRAKIETTLKTTIIIKLVRYKMDNVYKKKILNGYQQSSNDYLLQKKKKNL